MVQVTASRRRRPLTGVPWGLLVRHVLEPEVRDQVPAEVYEAQVALMERSLDREAILSELREAQAGRGVQQPLTAAGAPIAASASE